MPSLDDVSISKHRNSYGWYSEVHTTNHEVPFDVVSHDPEEDARREHNGFGIEIRLAGNVIFQILPLLLTEQFFSLLKGGTVKHWDIICRT